MGRAVMLILAGVLTMATVAVGSRDPARPSAPVVAPAGAQEAEVASVVVDPRTHQALVVLQGKRDRRTVTLAIGPFEANGIAVPLQGVRPPRPLTHDLLLTVIGQLRGSLTRIVITDLRDDTYFARLDVVAGGGPLQIDSRPSDAIALALRARVPILVEERVFEKSERALPRPGGGPTL